MNKNVVRIQFERVKAGETAVGHIIDIYIHPPRNYTWYPKAPRFTMLDDPQGVHSFGRPGQMMRFDEGGLLMRFDALGPECPGVSKGDIDFLMTTVPASKLFAEDLPHFADQASYRLDVFNQHATWAMLAIYDVDVEAQEVEFEAGLELEEIAPDEPI